MQRSDAAQPDGGTATPPRRTRPEAEEQATAVVPAVAADLPVRIVDAALAGCIFLVPLLMGGRHPAGQLLLVALAAAAALGWAVHLSLRGEARWRRTTALPLLLAGVLLPAIQITPLPQALFERIAPHTFELLPLWTPAADPAAKLGRWNTISLTPAETRSGLVFFAAYGLLFLVAVQRIQSVDDLEQVLRWLAMAVVVMACFGLVQHFAGNGAFFWFYEHPFSKTSDAVKGSFSNRNHFAHFLALGIGPLLWWIQAAGSASRQAPWQPRGTRPGPAGNPVANLLLVALGVVVFAALLSLSRGGIVAGCLAATIAAAVLGWKSANGRRLAAVLAVASLLIGVALAIFGYDRVSRRLEDLSSGSLARLDPAEGRRAIWRAVLKAAADHPALGSGVGSHREVYPLYFDLPSCDTEFTHAENCYLQVALETGIPGLLLVMAGVGLCAFWCAAGLARSASDRLSACLGAIAASLAASAAHALVDFVWYVPGCTAVIAILAACAQRARQLAQGSAEKAVRAVAGRQARRKDRRPGPSNPTPARDLLTLSRPAAVAMTAVATIAALGMIHNRIGPVSAEANWCRFLTIEAAGQTPPQDRQPPASAEGRPPSSPAIETQRERIACLERVVRSLPSHARARLELARSYLGLFDLQQASAENAMSLANLRDAAIASKFRGREELQQWLARAVGRHWVSLDRALEHTRAALQLCPLQGDGYLFLAKLCFLDGAQEGVKTALVEQALRVRPFDGGVLYECAAEAWLAGDPTGWLNYLRRASRSGRRHQQYVLSQLLEHTPPEAIEEMIDLVIGQLDPDIEGLEVVHRLAARRGRPDQLVRLREHFAKRSEAEARSAAGPRAAGLWMQAHRLYRDLGNPADARRCAGSAQACGGAGEYEARYGQALCLIELGQFAEADRHLQWCLQRKPDSASLRDLAKQVLRKRLDQPDHARAGSMGVVR
jgi:O-antigen ligase/tetratricopeptide (TPR) repeat protein